MMDELLLKIAEEERLDYFFRLDREVVGSKLYHFMRRFVDKYNSLPPLAECQKHTTVEDFSAPFEYYWEQHQNERLARKVMELDLARITESLEKGNPREAVEIFKEFVAQLDAQDEDSGIKTMTELARDFEKYLSEPPGEVMGITTGWPTLDRVSQGCQPGDLCLITGRAKTGKTMALLHLFKSAHLSGARPMLISMEMSLLQVAKRLFSLYAGVTYEAVKTRRLSTPAKKYLGTILQGLSELPEAYFVEGNFILGLWKLKAAILAAKPDIVLIDGAYLLKSRRRHKSVWEAAKEVADELKRIALSTEIPIVAAFQLNRETTRKKAESVGLENIHLTDALSANCSWAIGIFDTQGDPHRKLVRVLGAREGEAEDFLIKYDWERMDFSEIEDEEGGVAEWIS